MLKFLFGAYDKHLRGRLGKKRARGFELSNLGAFPKAPAMEDESETAEGWRIREVLFVQADATLGAAIKLNVVGTPDGGLGISVTWGMGAVDDDVADAFHTAFQEGLRTLVATKDA